MADISPVDALTPEGVAVTLRPVRRSRGWWCVEVLCGDAVVDCYDGQAGEKTARWIVGVLEADWAKRRSNHHG